MTRPTLEPLETRTLLSAGVLSPGMGQLFDFDLNGTNDAVLVNTGTSDIEYEYLGGNGLANVKLTADGGKFVTNTFVAQVGDNSAADDFLLGEGKLGVSVKYRNIRFNPIAGASSVVEGAVSRLEIGKGDLLGLATTEGDVGKVYLCDGDLTDASSAGAIDRLVIEGDILGLVQAVGNIGMISANRLDAGHILGGGQIGQLAIDVITNAAIVEAPRIGTVVAKRIDAQSQITSYGDMDTLQACTIADATVSVAADMGRLAVNNLIGSAYGTSITVGGHLAKLIATTISGGDNGMLNLSVGAGLDCLSAGLIEGGQASDSGFSGAFLSVIGTVDKMCVGMLSGGQSDGAGSFSLASFQVYGLYDGDGSLVEAGDVVCLNAAAISGGVSTNGGDAMLTVTISNDLLYGRIGQMIGNGNARRPICDPSIYLSVGHDIVKLIAGDITAGTASGEYAYASMNIAAGNDILQLVAGRIDAGSAEGVGSEVAVRIDAGRDIGSITARTFSGGSATGADAMAGVYIEAARHINFIGAGLITGTQARVPIFDPTVRFIAGGDIGMVMAGRITGGRVTADGESAGQASVLLRAEGVYVNEDGSATAGDIGCIVTGMIDGGSASGANALSYVKISAAHDIGKLYSDAILGGGGSGGGFSYVSIVAEHNINELCAGTISGTGGGNGCDPAVQIQAYNDIKSFSAAQIIAGDGGTVNILAGVDANGNVSGDGEAGSIEHMVVGLISGDGGIVNIAAGGNIDDLKVCRIVSGDGEVNIVAGGDITADVRSIRSWTVNDESGVEFQAGGAVNDVRNSIKDEYVQEGLGGDVEIPAPADLPE